MIPKIQAHPLQSSSEEIIRYYLMPVKDSCVIPKESDEDPWDLGGDIEYKWIPKPCLTDSEYVVPEPDDDGDYLNKPYSQG